MAGKISELAVLAAPDAADYVEVLDVSDLSMAASGTNKKTPVSALGGGSGGSGGGFPCTHGVVVPHTGYVTGASYPFNHGPVPNGGAVGTNGPLNQPAGSVFWQPAVFAQDATITQIGIKLAGATLAERRAWFGVYNDNGSAQPGTRVGYGELVLPNATGAGAKWLSGLTIPVTAGNLYWVGMNANWAQNGSADWWSVVTSLYTPNESYSLLRSNVGYVTPAATAPAASFDSGWGTPLVLFQV